MSGRLILLPKKSYTPWNTQTVERVLRDERLEAQRLEKQRSDDARKAGLERIRKLKGATTSKDDDGDDGAAVRKATDGEEAAPRHVNLFQAEETEMLQRTLRGCATDTDNNAEEDGTKRRREEVGILPVFLDGRTSSQNGYRTRGRFDRTSRFQLDSKFTEISAEERRKDERIKLNMDPANAFVRTNDSVEGIDDKSLALTACPDSGDGTRNPVHVEKLNHASNDDGSQAQDVNRWKQRSDTKQKRSSMNLSSNRHRRRRCSLDANCNEEEMTSLASSSRSGDDSASEDNDSYRSKKDSRKRRRKTSKRYRRDRHRRTKHRTTRDRDGSSDDEADESRCSISGRDRKRRRKSSKDERKYRRRKIKTESNDYRDKRSSSNRKSDTSAATATSLPASSLAKQSTASTLEEMKQRQLLREREETRREMLLHIQAAEARQY